MTDTTSGRDSSDTGRQVVDPRGPRFGAGITALLLLVVLYLGLIGAVLPSAVILTAIAGLFAWGAFAGIGRHPYGVLFRRFVRPRIAPPREWENEAPPTFAQGVGLVVTGAGLLLGAVGLPSAIPVAAGLAFVAAFLNSVFGYCLGCQIYLLLVRARLIRSSAA